MTMSEKLLPCPFCGGEAKRVDIEEGENAGGSCVACTSCNASSNVEFEFKENFISNWNRRISSWVRPDNIDNHPKRYSTEQRAIEGILLRRLWQEKLDGYVLETSIEIIDAIAPTPDPRDAVVEALADALKPLAAIADEYDDREDGGLALWLDADVLRPILLLLHARDARTALRALAALDGRK